jgi:hypothetical protein
MAMLKAFRCPCAGLVQRLSERCHNAGAMMPRRCLSESTADVTWDCGEKGCLSIRLRVVLAFRKRTFQQQSRQIHLLSFGTAKLRACDSDFHKLIFNQACLSLSLALARTRLEIHNPPIGTRFSVSAQHRSARFVLIGSQSSRLSDPHS